MPIVLGYGTIQKKYHGRPMCNSGKMPAHATANSVIASAKRLIEVRHFWCNKSKMAEMSVPAWPMPIHHTKLMMAKPQATGTLMPQTPTPTNRSQKMVYSSIIVRANMKAKPSHQPRGVCRASVIELIFSETERKV